MTSSRVVCSEAQPCSEPSPPRTDSISHHLRARQQHGQWRRQGGRGEAPLYWWTSKNHVICVCFHCHGTSGTAPSYLAETLRSTADVGSRRRLRSASKSTLVILTTRRTTLGDRAFSVTAARAWNAVPSSVRSAPSLLQFRRDLKTAMFQSSYSSP